MSQNRRDFLKASLAGSGVVAWGLDVPGFLSRTAAATADADKKGAKDTLLVLIELTGGNDGLNTVVPFKDENYAKLRPNLKLPGDQIKKLTDDAALHPQMAGVADLYTKDGEVCVVQGVGYPNPTQSHFRSMDIWQAASTAESFTEGWVGKALKAMPATPAFHLKTSNERSPLALEGAPMRAPSIASLDEFQLQLAAASGADKKDQRDFIEGSAKADGKDKDKPSLLDFVQRTANNTYASSKRLQEIGKNYQPKATYPNTPLANRLKLAAQLIDAALGARIFYVALDGFDTHAGQLPAHANLLGTLSGAVTAFYKDLAARGHKERLLVMTFSEFGRRPKENGSRGTDHGAAAPLFLVGGKVKGGVVGKQPSLTDVEQGNLKFGIDFRQVYGTILDKWLGVPSKDVLGKQFDHVEILR